MTAHDLRLVPAACVAGAVAWCVPSLDAARLLMLAVAVLVATALVSAALMAVARVSTARVFTALVSTPLAFTARVTAAPATRVPGQGSAGSRAINGTIGQVLLTGAAIAAVLLSGAGQVAAARTGDVVALADAGATVRVVATVLTDPVPRTSPWSREPTYRLQVRVVELDARGVTARGAAVLDIEGDASWATAVVGSTVLAEGRLRTGDGRGDAVARLSAGGPPVQVAAPGAGLATAATIRTALLEVTDGLSPQARGLVPGVAVGDTTRLPDDVDEAMLATSLTHVTAVSGGHFAIVVATLAWCCGLLRSPRWVRIAVTGAATVAFVVLVRPDPSVLRAAATGAVGLVALGLGRPARAVPALAATVLVLLVVDPWLARSYGFVLSTVATAGLVTLTAPMVRRLAPWTGSPVAFAIAVPVAAQAACGPVLVLLAPSIALYGVPANLFAGLALAPATVLGLVAALLAPVLPGVATAVAWAAGLATGWIAGVAQIFAALPGAAVPWPGGVRGAALLAVLTLVAGYAVRTFVPVPDQRDGSALGDVAGGVVRHLRRQRSVAP